MGIKISISPILKKEIEKKFKKESIRVVKFLMSLKENHHKGDLLTQIGGISIKEIKYNGFRFYYVVDNYRLKLFDRGELNKLLLKFVRMSNKKTQQKVINSIKEILKKFGDEKL
jgi:hypothetical protein